MTNDTEANITPDEDLPDPDQRLAELLDKYVADVQAGRMPDREAILRDYPQWESALDCLDMIEDASPGDLLPMAESSGGRGADDRLSRDSSDAAEPIPQLDGYIVHDEIGRGGMGVVYRATQETLGRVVALKMILGGRIASAAQVNRFQTEARTAARLQHPNIVRIHEVGQQDGEHFFTMDFVKGESLAGHIAREPMEIREAARLLVKVVRAVEYLHQQDVVHRDLKPSNILIDRMGEPLVTDFGLAKVFQADSQATATDVIAGTPAYMAPEQARGSSKDQPIGPAADVYSLGTILYELLAGHPPLTGETPLDTLMAVLERTAQPPRRVGQRIPRPLQRICMKCLEKLPEKRYASAGELADDLERYLAGEPTKVRPKDPISAAVTWGRSQPALASRIAALGFFLVLSVFNVTRGATTREYFIASSSVLMTWLIASAGCQAMLNTRRYATESRYIWAGVDLTLLLVVLLISNGIASVLMIGYPLLIVGSGLWYQVRFVWLTSCASLLSYGILLVDYYLWRPELHLLRPVRLDEHIIQIVSMIVLGIITGHLVTRVRTLTMFRGR